MANPTSKKRYSPNIKPGKGSVKGRTRSGKFPKYLEDFCHHIHSGFSTRESAVLVGRSPSSGPYLFHREDVQRRLVEITEEYKASMVEERVESTLLSEQYLDAHTMQMAAHGEGKGKRGRLKACELGYKKLKLIDPPSPQTLAFMQIQAGAKNGGGLGMPKPFEAQRFVKLRQSGAYESEYLKLKAPTPDPEKPDA